MKFLLQFPTNKLKNLHKMYAQIVTTATVILEQVDPVVTTLLTDETVYSVYMTA